MFGKHRILSVTSLAMINIAAASSIRNWPIAAEYGFSSLFFLLIAALCFFIPVALVSAELATAWPKAGGLYAWVKEAFGHKVGFLAIWLQWANNLAFYPLMLSFIAGTLAYTFAPELANNIFYTVPVILIVFWGMTLLNLRGMQISSHITNLGVWLGTFIPAGVIIFLGINWWMRGLPLQIDVSSTSFFPPLNDLKHLVFFTGILFSLAGLEMSAVHALDVEKPQRDYPRAILISVVVILTLYTLGVLALASVVPQQEISLVTGPIQAFAAFMLHYGWGWMVPVLALLMVIGVVGSLSTWIAGPCRGLLAVAQDGDLPAIFRKTNKANMPSTLLIAQALITSLLSLFFLFMPSINSAFWLLTALAAQIYLVGYVLLFAAGLYLRWKHPHTHRPYKVPGGKWAMTLLCCVGGFTSLVAIAISFLPPQQLLFGSPARYATLLAVGLLFFCTVPFISVALMKPWWQKLLFWK